MIHEESTRESTKKQKARFRRRTFHVLNLLQMSSNKGLLTLRMTVG